MLSEDYIVGLTDGEGSFTVYPRASEVSTWNNRVECHYYLKMRKDELPLLKEVYRFFNCGRISLQKDKRPNHRDCYRFEVSDLENIRKKVIPLFKRNRPHSTSRKNDFRLFCRIVKMTERKHHQTREGWKEILKLKSQMHK
jgi:hypothetical protein